jgi:hypothetical protein
VSNLGLGNTIQTCFLAGKMGFATGKRHARRSCWAVLSSFIVFKLSTA